MRPARYIVIFILLLGSILSCKTGSKENPSDKIRMYGHVDSIMAGNFDSVYEIDSLASMNHVYALGAMDSLKGEIQIFDDEVFHSMVMGDSIEVGSTEINKALLLVYTEVNNWNNYELPMSVANMEALVGYLQYGDQFEDIRADDPFVFLIEGQAEQLDWHVLKQIGTDSLTGNSDHDSHALKGRLEDVEVEIFGIYTKEHEGIVTHSGIPVHMHFKTADGTLAGHLDHLELGPEMRLRIPKSK